MTHSSPTRRSSDLIAADVGAEGDHHALKGKAAALRRQHLVGHRLRAGQRVGLPGLACREEHRRDGEHEEAWGHGLSHFTVPTRTSSRICRSEEHTSELQSLMRISYAVFCLK